MKLTTKERGPAPKKAQVTGLARGLTNYGDADFSLYMRRSFAKSMGYSPEMLERPVVGIAQTASGKQLPPPFPGAGRGGEARRDRRRRLAARLSDHLAGRGVPEPDQHDVPQSHV